MMSCSFSSCCTHFCFVHLVQFFSLGSTLAFINMYYNVQGNFSNKIRFQLIKHLLALSYSKFFLVYDFEMIGASLFLHVYFS